MHKGLLTQAACVRHACLRAPCVAWPLLLPSFSLSSFFSVFCFNLPHRARPNLPDRASFSAFYGQRLVTAAWATRSPWSINFKSHIIFILTIKELRNFLEFSILCKEILWNQICLEFPRKLKMLKSLSYFNLVPVNLYKETRKHANL